MADVIRTLPSVTISIPADGPITLEDLKSFINQAFAMGVAMNKLLTTTLTGPAEYDQREGRDPGSFTIQAMP